jgi:hypothetical protein
MLGGDQEQGFHRGLPFVGIVLRLGQLLRRVAQRQQWLAALQIGSEIPPHEARPIPR